MTKTIKLWFNQAYNLYFPKTSLDCKVLMEAHWTNVPCFTPPGVTRPGLNSIDQLYGFLTSQGGEGNEFNLQLENYLPSHLGKTNFEEKVGEPSGKNPKPKPGTQVTSAA